jgi:hypothetical protein
VATWQGVWGFCYLEIAKGAENIAVNDLAEQVTG